MRLPNIHDAAVSVSAAISAKGQRSDISNPARPLEIHTPGDIDRVAQRIDCGQILHGRGMLLIGVVRPDSSENGMISSIEYSIACCMVAATAETSKPMPTAASRNSSRPA